MNHVLNPRRPAWRRGCALALLLGLAVVALVVAPAGAQEATPDTQEIPKAEHAGSLALATVKNDGSPGSAIAEGGSATEFTLGLPDDAACQGDSAKDSYRVQGYWIPEGTDPTTVNWSKGWPSVGQPLFITDTRDFTNQLTAVSPAKGEPGPIVGLPAFNFAVFEPGSVPDGVYTVVLACSLWNQVTRYWDTQIRITNTATDKPAGLTWTALGGDVTASSGSSSIGTTLIVVVVVLVLASLGFVFMRRRRTPPSNPVSFQEER